MGIRFRLFAIGIIAALIALMVCTLVVWKFGWDWTGFNGGYSQITTMSTSHGITIAVQKLPGKTLWDLLQLLIIPVIVGLGAAWYTAQQGKVSGRENIDNQRETALQAYIDNMSELLLEKRLRTTAEESEQRKIARVRTLTVLPRLDPNRKTSVLLFLYESHLIDKDKRIIDLRGADLIRANLTQADLIQANLSGANLSGANLTQTNLIQANLSGANLSGANLTQANLSKANLSEANLTGADLREANFKAFFNRTNLSGANLTQTNLSMTNVTEEQLKQARSLEGATMPDGSKHT